MDHGDLCIARVPGTELEKFSNKAQRPVVVAYLLDQIALVYPLTSTLPQHKEGIVKAGEKTWVITRDGLYAVPLDHLNPNGEKLPGFHRLSEMIRRDIGRREASALARPGERLAHKGLADLEALKKPEEPKIPPAKQPPRKRTDAEIFEDYMGGLIDLDMKNPGFDGRPEKKR